MKFHSKPVSEHEEVPLADAGRLEEIVQASQRRQAPAPTTTADAKPCFVLSIGPEKDPAVRDAQLGEIRSLVRAQGGLVVGEAIHVLSRPDPKTFLGPGRARQYADEAYALGATMIVVDAELSPSQLRNLEDAAGIAICDREAVILNVFLRHASSRRSRIQVEIAQLEYLRPRICGVGINMDQQAGGIGARGGPGETASELMARKLDGRLAELRKLQQGLERSADARRGSREDCLRIALVGYTNAGKTSLMNALTAEHLTASPRPFETLDTTSRSLTRHGGPVLLSDTVGFIRRLPERLMGSFESTLSEIREASLLAIVVDASDYEWRRHLETTTGMLKNLGAERIPRHVVFNKADRLSGPPSLEEFERLAGGHPHSLLSAADAGAVEGLKEALIERVRGAQPGVEVFVPYMNPAAMALIYGRCRILTTRASEDGLHATIQAPAGVIAAVRRSIEEAQQ
jgi:GTP-binding protein HflX